MTILKTHNFNLYICCMDNGYAVMPFQTTQDEPHSLFNQI